MDRITYRKILAEMYNCPVNQLLSKYENMVAQIRNDAIVTLCFEKTSVDSGKVMA
jgi:hypothetical protein